MITNMDQDESNYYHNQTYRKQIQLLDQILTNVNSYLKEHRDFQSFPQKNDESDVESVSLESGNNYYSQNENKDSCIDRETIYGTMKEMQKSEMRKYSQLGEMKSSIMSPNLKRQIFQNKAQSRIITNANLDASIMHTAYIEEVEQKIEPVRLMKAMKLLVNVQHFYRQLTNNTRIVNKLSIEQHRLIGDTVSYYSNNLFNPKSHSIMICKLFYKIQLIVQYLRFPIFAPSSIFIKVWDSILSALILFCTLLFNLELFFVLDIEKFRYLFQILFTLTLVDILIELNTGVIQKGNIPIFTQMLHVHLAMKMKFVMNIMFIFKWLKIKKVFIWLSFYLSYEKNKKNMFDLIRLLFFIIGICHLFCLFWHGLALYEINMGMSNTWLNSKNLVESTVYERYAYSFYFLAVTMITVGYGDITPQNSLEIIFTILTMFVTGIVYAFSLNTIGSIIDNIEKKDKKYKESMQVIHGLMREENVTRELRNKVSNYIEYLYKVINSFFNFQISSIYNNEQESNEVLKKQEKLIIDKLSVKLRNDLMQDIQGKYLSNIPLFKNLKEREKVSNIMEEYLYSPGEVIFTQGDLDDCSLFYLVKGSVQIMFLQNSDRREDTVITNKGKQEYFGEISFITGNPRSMTVKASDFCRVYKISRDKFLDIIKDNPYDFENFQMVKEAIFLNNNYKFCSIKCLICQQGNHYSANCPRIHLTLTKQVVISRYNFSIPHIERIPHCRQKKKLNYIQKSNQMQEDLFEINRQESLFEILDEIEQCCNFIDLSDDEINSQSDGFTKKTDEQTPQKIQRLRTSESNKFKSALTNQQVSLTTLTDNIRSSSYKQGSDIPQQRNVKQKSNNKIKSETQKSAQSSNTSNPSSSSSFQSQSSSSSSSSQSSSDSSLDTEVKKQKTNKSHSSNNSPRNKEALKGIKIFNSQNEFLTNIDEIQTSAMKSQPINSNRKIELDPQNKSVASSVKLSSRLLPEIEIQEKLYAQHISPINEVPEYSKQQSENSSQCSSRQRNKSGLSNILQASNLQNEHSRFNSKFGENKPPPRISTNSQNNSNNNNNYCNNNNNNNNNNTYHGRRTLRYAADTAEIDILKQSVMNFLTTEQKVKNSVFFNPESHNKKNQFVKLSTTLKNPIQDYKRTSGHRLTNLPAFLQHEDAQQYLNKLFGIKVEQKQDQILEPDQVNYLMLQTFDKAKIFKHYLPHFNYPEIIKKWNTYQKKFNQKFNKVKSQQSKKKQQRQYQSKRQLIESDNF